MYGWILALVSVGREKRQVALLALVLCGCERSRSCEDFELPLLSCGADGFEGNLVLDAARGPTVTADFGCGFELDGENARVVPSGQTCMDPVDASSGDVRSFTVHCTLPEGSWNVAMPVGNSIRVTVKNGIQTCGT